MKILASTIVFVVASGMTKAQDTQYWTYRFGTRAALMGGAAVGGIEDNSSVVYNPALLTFVKSKSVSLNANVYQVVNVLSRNGAGTGLDVSSSQFSVVPITFSGLLPKSENSRLTMGYALLVPTEFTFKASAYTSGPKNIVAESLSPGPEDFVGQFALNARLTENMGAFAFAYKLDDHWSLGLTNEFIYRSHTYARSELARLILNNSAASLVSTSETVNVEYTNLRYDAKIGVAYYAENWSAGLVVKSPSLNLLGSATVARDFVANNLLINIETNPSKPANFQRVNYAANDRQTGLPTTYKSPLSIAFGLCYKYEKSIFAFSMEWFGSTGIYNIVSPPDQSFRRPTNLPLNGQTFMQVSASNLAVLNLALGYERNISQKFNLSCGLRSNGSFFDPVYDQRVDQRFQKVLNDNAINLDISSWDIYHAVLGGTFKKERRDLYLGINYGFAFDRSVKQFANFDNPSEPTFLLGQRNTTSAHFFSLGVLLGYTFRLKSTN